MSQKEKRLPTPAYVERVGAEIAGREMGVIVSPKHELVLIGCDGALTPRQGATARTLLDRALAFVAEREGPQIIPARRVALSHPAIKGDVG